MILATKKMSIPTMVGSDFVLHNAETFTLRNFSSALRPNSVVSLGNEKNEDFYSTFQKD